MPHLLVGALVNARAVAEAVASILASTELNATVLACGERWKEPDEDGEHCSRLDVYGAVPVMQGEMLAARECDSAL